MHGLRSDSPTIVDKLFVVYLVLHIFITVLIDATIVVPESYWFDVQKSLRDLHISSTNDPLLKHPSGWLKGFVWVELILQTPFFIYGSYGLLTGSKTVWPLLVVYGVEAATSTAACMFELSESILLSFNEKVKLQAIYAPTLVIPLLITFYYGRRTIRALNFEEHLKLD